MKIKGRRDLQDYFDHVGHMYGQDDRIVYVREPFDGRNSDGLVVREVVGDTASCLSPHQYLKMRRWDSLQPSLSFVVAAKWVFPVISFPGTGPSAEELLDPVRHGRWLLEDHLTGKAQFPTQPSPEDLVAVVRAVGAPIFRVLNVRVVSRDAPKRSVVIIDERVPHLGALGVGAVVPPEQMWQEVYAVCSNVLRADPDKMPPAPISNADRIHTAGFDAKTSFRHPVK